MAINVAIWNKCTVCGRLDLVEHKDYPSVPLEAILSPYCARKLSAPWRYIENYPTDDLPVMLGETEKVISNVVIAADIVSVVEGIHHLDCLNGEYDGNDTRPRKAKGTRRRKDPVLSKLLAEWRKSGKPNAHPRQDSLNLLDGS